jgi:hypothetical protein
MEGKHRAASVKRTTRVLRKGGRRGFRSFTIGVSQDDLRVIAERGYGGAASTDPDERGQALSRFITDMLVARRSARNGVVAVATSFQ